MPICCPSCRYLLHVLPCGFVKIRRFGFLANRNRKTSLACAGVCSRADRHQYKRLLRNGNELTAVLSRHPQVRWIICGHVHLDQAVVRNGLTMLTTPSTCVQFSKVSPQPLSVPGPAGFRGVDFAGSWFSTQVLRRHGATSDV